MIDLHIHSNHSDGTENVIDILKKSEELNLETISITDHDNCNVYNELKDINISNYYSGKLITGIELKSGYKDHVIDILGYNIDYKKMIEILNNSNNKISREEIEEIKLQEFYKWGEKLNLELTPMDKLEWNKEKNWASVIFYKEIKKHEINKGKLPDDFWESFDNFKNNYYSIKGQIFYVSIASNYPSLRDTIEMIHEAGGLAFVAHFYKYRFIENKIEELKYIINNYNIDGIECYHSSFNEGNIKELTEFCLENNLLISGGSDWHGSGKPGVKLGIGYGNLNVPGSIINNWKI